MCLYPSVLFWSYISCLLLAFKFLCSCFSSSFNCDVRLSILDLSHFLTWALSAINFPLNTALAVSQRFCYIVSLLLLVSNNLFISVLILLFTQQSFRSRLFSFHVVVRFWVSFLILSSNLIALRDYFTSSLLHLLRSVLLPIMWSILEQVLCGLRKMHILLIWGGEFCRCLLGLLGPEMNSSPEHSY